MDSMIDKSNARHPERPTFSFRAKVCSSYTVVPANFYVEITLCQRGADKIYEINFSISQDQTLASGEASISSYSKYNMKLLVPVIVFSRHLGIHGGFNSQLGSEIKEMYNQ